MLTWALLFLSDPVLIQPQTKPAMPSQQIIISGKIVELPYLPESVAAANKAFGALSAGMNEGLRDLEHTLVGLYASPDARITLPGEFKIEKKQGEDLRFLVSIMSGDAYRELEGPCHQAWDEWQGALVRNGLANPVQGMVPTSPLSQVQIKEDQEIRNRQKGLQKTERAVEQERVQVLEMMATSGGTGDSINSNVEWVMSNRANAEAGVVTGQVTAHIANRHVPSLAKVWIPLANRLNADALQLASNELGIKPSAPPAFRALRTRARIQFLERFRSALWFSLCVWTRMVGQQPPAPLRELNASLPDPSPSPNTPLPR